MAAMWRALFVCKRAQLTQKKLWTRRKRCIAASKILLGSVVLCDTKDIQILFSSISAASRPSLPLNDGHVFAKSNTLPIYGIWVIWDVTILVQPRPFTTLLLVGIIWALRFSYQRISSQKDNLLS
uniref:LAGLIDADG homing endonuclease n=1 Tax=Marophrys sp. SRT127 TaxID=2488311 RepID=A0A455RE81_9EUKA|nr:hypothetical protein [Marophrys sp. SRT127]BBH42974.1 LAGLIDADG homing endonuclease [Marophrys sp. SRT127]